MTATVEASQEAPQVITRIEDLPDELRAELVARREAGTTLSELKTGFPQVAPDVIREVLPPMNKREAQAREAKTKKDEREARKAVNEVIETKAKTEKPKPEPKSKPAPRYVEDAAVRDQLAREVLAARERVGRDKLAAFMQTTGSAVWRWEHGKIHPNEVDYLREQLARVEAGELPEPAPRPVREPKAKTPSKTQLAHRLDVLAELLRTARGDKSISKAALVDAALAIIEPQPAEEATSA
jgi:ribosome-binding protein aMBF1 (putative translation factor)